MKDLKHLYYLEKLLQEADNDLVKEAQNDGLKQAIEKVLKLKVVELDTDPQLMGAIGAAEFARQKGMNK